MKINKWTLGLAAAGLVSLSPAIMAQTPAPAPAAPAAPTTVPLMTALSATTISGYVDTSAVWNPGTGNGHPAPFAFNFGKQDGFNIDLVDLKLQKPVDEGKWSAGYTAEFMAGPDAGGISPDIGANELGIREAHVDLNIPVGNGIGLQIGRWSNLIGYESTTSYLNANWTHSYAWTLQPTEHTGVLASYKFGPAVSLQVGVANTLTTVALNGRNASGLGGGATESKKAVVSLLTLTAPDSWGFMKGSSFYAGLDYGPGFGADAGGTPEDRTHLYIGTTLNTPVNNLTFGAEYDSIWNTDVGGIDYGYTMNVVGYVTYKVTDKLSLNGRGEYDHGNSIGGLGGLPYGTLNKVIALTGTVEYDLWANVVSRVEVRWDHAADGSLAFGGASFAAAPTKRNDVMIAANVIYKF